MNQCLSRAARASSGFQLFSEELLTKNVALIKHFSNDPELKRPVLEAIWKSLTLQRRRSYNERANLLSVVKHQQYRKPTTEDAVLYFLRKEKNLVKWTNPSFLESLAQTSAASLSAHQKKKLKSLFLSDNQKLSNVALSLKEEQANGKWTNMAHFNSFTDMLRVLAPTRKILYLQVTASFSGESLSKPFLIAAARHYTALSEDERQIFAPIKDRERLKFERFCGMNCGGMNKGKLDIIALFAAFRGIMPLDKKNELDSARELYKTFLSMDHVHDSDFLRARRALTRFDIQRSSEAGLYILKHRGKAMSASVSPDTYMIHHLPSLDDITVAEMLVSTRLGCSVYDDVLERADMLRTKANSKKLGIYRVREITQHHVLRQGRSAPSKKVEVKLSKTFKGFIRRAEEARKNSTSPHKHLQVFQSKAHGQRAGDRKYIAGRAMPKKLLQKNDRPKVSASTYKSSRSPTAKPTVLPPHSHTIVRMPPFSPSKRKKSVVSSRLQFSIIPPRKSTTNSSASIH